MKNGDLVVLGYPAACFFPEFIVDTEELVEFEYASYNAYDETYGEGACDRDDINTLADIYGQEFSDRLFKRRWKLLARERLAKYVEEYAAIGELIASLKEFIENPTPKLEDMP
jgi:hypothetical protein